MSEPSEHVIHETLSRAYAREQEHGREQVYFRTALDEMISKEEGETVDEYAVRGEAFDRLLEYFFAEGPHPGHVIRRVFAMAKARRADLILNMSLHELGLMLGETKAAGSWRIRKLVNRPLEESGERRGVHLPWQKSAEACSSYATSSTGNTNRRDGKKSRKSTTKKKTK